MVTPEDKIRDLKAKIAEYKEEYVNAALGSEDKRELRAINTAKETRLNLLLQQRPQAQGGEQ
jgi:hypothetical protein